jgi:hypothetical protein
MGLLSITYEKETGRAIVISEFCLFARTVLSVGQQKLSTTMDDSRKSHVKYSNSYPNRAILCEATI